MNFVRIVASTLALVSTLAVVPAVAQAAEGPRPGPVAVERDHRGEVRRGEDRDLRWGFDRAGHWGQFGREDRRDFDRDWRGYRPAWIQAGMRDDTLCRVEWENGAPPERMFVLGCFVR
jgi:hypothetical protein